MCLDKQKKRSHSVVVITPDFESGNPSSNLGGTLIFFCYKLSDIDVMSEWLRRWTANPLGSARAGSNPAGIDFFIYD